MTDREKIQAAKAELNSYYDLFRKTQNLRNNLAELRSRMESIRVFQGSERVQGGHNNTDTLEYYIDKCTALEGKIAGNIWAMSDRQNEIESKINTLQGVCAVVLHKRYIERKRFEEIAVECNYAWRQIMRLHKRALLQFAEKMS